MLKNPLRQIPHRFITGLAIFVVVILGNTFVPRTVALSTPTQDVVRFCETLSGASGDGLKQIACVTGVQKGESECTLAYPQNDGSGLFDVCKRASEAQQNNQIERYAETVVPQSNGGMSDGGGGTTGGSGGTGDGTDWEAQIRMLTDQFQKNLDGINQAIDILQGLQKAVEESLGVVSSLSQTINGGCSKSSNVKNYYINGKCSEQPIHELRPAAPGGNSPVILFFNGGSWLSNDCSGEHVTNTLGMKPDCGAGLYQLGSEAARNTALTSRYAVYDVSYRYGTSGVYYQLEDVLRGIRHFRENAEIYGIDPSKIIIWGDSAGGSLTMRAAATGTTGAKAVVGWSTPTNAYTAIFRSFQSLGVGMAHTTCVPTDLAGITNALDLLTGGDGTEATYDGGISSNGFTNLSTSPQAPFAILSELFDGAKYLNSIAGDVEVLSKQIINRDGQGLAAGAINFLSNKFVECIENFNAMSPALFASPDTPPTFLAGFDNDGVVGPEQAYGMRDKLQQLGIESEALIRPGDSDCAEKAAGPAFSGGCHLGYYRTFVCPSIRFVESILEPDRPIDCEAP